MILILQLSNEDTHFNNSFYVFLWIINLIHTQFFLDLFSLIYYEKIKIKEKVDVNSEANENVIVNHSNDNNNDKFEDSNISDWNSNLNEKEGNMTEYEKDSQNNDCATPPIKSNNFFLNVYKTESIYQIFQHRVLLMMMIL